MTKKIKKLEQHDLRRIIHSLKVGPALTLVSLFYYIQPLYDHFGEKKVIWAIFTVIIVFEFSVGKLLYIYIYIWYNSFSIGTKNSICNVFLFYFFPPIGETRKRLKQDASNVVSWCSWCRSSSPSNSLWLKRDHIWYLDSSSLLLVRNMLHTYFDNLPSHTIGTMVILQV